MSFVEAAAALDRLLQEHQEGGAPSNVPPYAPPPPSHDDSNLLKTLLPQNQSSKLSSTPTAVDSLSAMIFPWETISSSILFEETQSPLCPSLVEEPPTPFCKTFSPLPSPLQIPLPIPTLPVIPSPSYPGHWLSPFDTTSCNTVPLKTEVTPRSSKLEVLSQPSKTTEDLPKSSRKKKRWSSRAHSESAAGTLEDDFVPLDAQKYKTELCRSYQVHGHCRYGARCNYAHGLEELRGAFRHGKYKTRNCQSYHQTGFCRYGARCSFIHDPEEGILKCSIANKEVLEALHYRPSSDDSPRTANITWRIFETSGETIPELHFISSTSPSQDQQLIENVSDSQEEVLYSHSPLQKKIQFLISTDNALDENQVFTCTFPIRNDVRDFLNSTLLLQENLDLLRSLQAGNYSDKEFVAMTSNEEQATKSRCSSGEFEKKIPSFESSQLLSLLSPIKAAVITEVDSDVSNDDVKEQEQETSGKSIFQNSEQDICQELKDLEIVHNILEEAPPYSSTVWSDGTNTKQLDITADASTQLVKNEALPTIKNDNMAKKNDHSQGKYRVRNQPKRKKHSCQKYDLEKIENGHLHASNASVALDDNVFLSETEEENCELEVSIGAAGADGDDWSEKSSLHLADLLRSLQLRDGNNQLIPWSKSGRRYSSDGSSAGPLSVNDYRSSPTSPASPRHHDMTKYKTELCRSFQYNGYCSYGDACLYAHGPNDLRSYPKHPMYRTKQCFSFHNKGFCLYGSRCQFQHDLE